MKFGVNILNYSPGATPESLQGWARFAEEIGYHLVMISDHVAITPDVQGQVFNQKKIRGNQPNPPGTPWVPCRSPCRFEAKLRYMIKEKSQWRNEKSK